VVHRALARLLAQAKPTGSRAISRERLLRGTQPSMADDMWYRARLRELVRRLDGASVEAIDELHSVWPHVHDASPRNADQIIARAAAKFGDISFTARRIATGAIRRNLKTTDQRLTESIRTSTGLDISGLLHSDPMTGVMQRALRANVDLITSIPQQHFERLRKAIDDSFTAGQRWEDLATSVKEIGGITDRRARFIARDQTGKMSAAFNEERQTSLGIEEYIWQDVGDGRVRPSHAAMNGRRCRWDSPPSVDGENVHPREAAGCRCGALPVLYLGDRRAESEAA
jgi:SPP1 gp7 family putative phage head morphogenesis protein